jgi:DNA-directed RNA polymerase specialized sigma24 family protein
LQSADEEDVAQEAFWGFVQSVRNQRVPQLATRHDLFALLTHIVACKAATQLESQMAAKRGAGRVFDESAFCVGSDMSFNLSLDQHPDTALAPSEVIVLNECYDLYVNCLPDGLRPVAELHVAGFTNREIGQQLGCVERTVERKLAAVRKSWQEKSASELED